MSTQPTTHEIAQQLDQYVSQTISAIQIALDVLDLSDDCAAQPDDFHQLVMYAGRMLDRCERLALETCERGERDQVLVSACALDELQFAAAAGRVLCLEWKDQGECPYTMHPMSNLLWTIRDAMERVSMWRSSQWKDWQRGLYMLEEPAPWSARASTSEPTAAVDPVAGFAQGRALALQMLAQARTMAEGPCEPYRKHRERGAPQLRFTADYLAKVASDPRLAEGFNAVLSAALSMSDKPDQCWWERIPDAEYSTGIAGADGTEPPEDDDEDPVADAPAPASAPRKRARKAPRRAVPA